MSLISTRQIAALQTRVALMLQRDEPSLLSSLSGAGRFDLAFSWWHCERVRRVGR
jgi:hypothetical protein